MRTRGIKALAAAASLAVLAMATHASASQQITVSDVEMDQTYEANIVGIPSYPGANGVNVYSNGVQFTATFNGSGQPVTDLFGFCIDVFHDIGLGKQTLSYMDNQGDPNPLTTDFGGGTLTNANPLLSPLDPTNQISDLTNLVDTGYYIHQHEAQFADAEMQLAAIQSAIWQIEVPTIKVTVLGANISSQDLVKYQNYFTTYTGSNYTSYADRNDRVFTITSLSNPAHQNFAIGWPIPGVPEPATWAMMLTGFFGMGSVLRRNRKAVAVAA
jgi:hypothetical protein